MATSRESRRRNKRASRPVGRAEPAARVAASVKQTDEERYALALESINPGVYDWDIVSHTIYYSPALRAIWGMPPDQVLTPEESTQRVHPDDLPQYRKALVDHLKGSTPRFSCEYRYVSSDGSWRWARQSGVVQRAPDGRALRMVGATSDITEAKLREQELDAARIEIETTREIMRTILENMNDGVVLIDKDFHWVFGNEHFNRFLDVPSEVTQPGASCYDVIRYQAERGDFGSAEDVEAAVQSRATMMRTPGGFR